MAISKENNKIYNDKFIAKIAEAIGVSPFNNPESWGDDPDNDFENDVLKHPFDKSNQDDVKQYHDYFGMGIGRNGPWKPLEDDEIVEYLKNHPQEIELWADDVDWDDEKDGSKFAGNTPDDPDDDSLAIGGTDIFKEPFTEEQLAILRSDDSYNKLSKDEFDALHAADRAKAKTARDAKLKRARELLEGSSGDKPHDTEFAGNVLSDKTQKNIIRLVSTHRW